MIIALFALAAAMIVGGLLAAFLGWDIVLIERGWTMVIAGSIFAASGALLLGVAAAVSRLAKMHEELARLHADLSEGEPAGVPTASEFSRAALAGGLLGGAAVAPMAAPERETDQPPLPLFPEAGEPSREPEDRDAEAARRGEPSSEPVAPSTPRAYREPSRGTEAEEAPEVKVPDFLIAGRHHETTYAEPGEPETEEAPREPGPAARQPVEPPAEETGREAAPEEARAAPEAEPVSEPVEAAEPAGAEADEARSATTIIGTYNSGDNRYVMYSDGSIEAETPQGVFRFNSLDELKEFIASGGEGSSAT